MGFFDFLKRLLRRLSGERLANLTPPAQRLKLEELARRIGLSVDQLETVPLDYHEFTVPKRNGGTRKIMAPNPQLKRIQRRILSRVLNRLKCHCCATGFERGHSIVTNANAHVDSQVVLRMDIIAFFRMTKADRVRFYLYDIGWTKKATDMLLRLCTRKGSLPQGAPTSPKLSNLVNIELDARLFGWAQIVGAAYTRYADDLTFSFSDTATLNMTEHVAQNPKTLRLFSRATRRRDLINFTIRMTKKVLEEYGYELHNKRKLNIRRRHQQQRVCGLVVNERVALPRRTRRWLRAVRHHHATGRRATLTAQQLAGWDALEHMIAVQAEE